MGALSSISLGQFIYAQTAEESPIPASVASAPSQDSYENSLQTPDVPKLSPPNSFRGVSADDFVAQIADEPDAYFDWKPGDRSSLTRNTMITGLTVGEPIVYGTGHKVTWSPLPENPGRTCLIRSRGIVLLPDNLNLETITAALLNPLNHPTLLTGVDESKNLGDDRPEGPYLHHVFNLQRSGRMQYVNESRVWNVPNGRVLAQSTVDPHRFPESQLFPDKRTDLLHNYRGRIAIFQIATGLVLVMEMESYVADVPAPTCGIAADMRVGPFAISRQPVAQRIEDRLTNIASLANPEWLQKHNIQFAAR